MAGAGGAEVWVENPATEYAVWAEGGVGLLLLLDCAFVLYKTGADSIMDPGTWGAGILNEAILSKAIHQIPILDQ